MYSAGSEYHDQGDSVSYFDIYNDKEDQDKDNNCGCGMLVCILLKRTKAKIILIKRT